MRIGGGRSSQLAEGSPGVEVDDGRDAAVRVAAWEVARRSVVLAGPSLFPRTGRTFAGGDLPARGKGAETVGRSWPPGNGNERGAGLMTTASRPERGNRPFWTVVDR